MASAAATSPNPAGVRRWVWIVGGLLVVAVLGASGVAFSVWRHPTAFPDGGGWGVGARDRELDQPVYVGMTYPDRDTEKSVRIDTVAGHGVSGTAEATLSFLVCTVDPEANATLGSGGQQDVEEVCSSVTPAAGAVLSLGEHPRQQLLLGITPTSDGVVRLHGLDVTYHDGWQHGTQRIGGDVTVRTAGARP